MKGRLYPKSTKAFLKINRSITSYVLINGSALVVENQGKVIRRSIDHMITLAKKNTLASKREAMQFLRKIKTKNDKPILQYLFDDLARKYKDRNGGYTRLIKAPNRTGDNSKMVILSLV